MKKLSEMSDQELTKQLQFLARQFEVLVPGGTKFAIFVFEDEDSHCISNLGNEILTDSVEKSIFKIRKASMK